MILQVLSIECHCIDLGSAYLPYQGTVRKDLTSCWFIFVGRWICEMIAWLTQLLSSFPRECHLCTAVYWGSFQRVILAAQFSVFELPSSEARKLQSLVFSQILSCMRTSAPHAIRVFKSSCPVTLSFSVGFPSVFHHFLAHVPLNVPFWGFISHHLQLSEIIYPS